MVGRDYVVENPFANASAPALWPHEKTAVNIEKQHENVELIPIHVENHYVQRELEWATQKNL